MSKLFMDKKYTEEDVRAVNLAINKMAEKYGALSEPMILARAIWNIFTNNNKERKRCREIIGRMLRDEAYMTDPERNLFRPIEDIEIRSGD